MAEWLDIWTKYAAKQGLDLNCLEPVRFTFGGIDRPERRPKVRWMYRRELDQGKLHIHKQMLLNNSLPGPHLESAGSEQTASYLVNLLEERGGDKQSLLTGILALISAATVHEFENNRELGYLDEEPIACIDEWVAAEMGQKKPFQWHRRSTTLGPGDSFLSSHDFDSPTYQRKLSNLEFVNAIVIGHKRIFRNFALVVPNYQLAFPEDIVDDLRDWWDQCNKNEEQRLANLREQQEAIRIEKEKRERRLDAKRRALLSPEKREQKFERLRWRNTTNEQLQELLFEAPITELAVRFQVSETAIRKRAKAAGLKQPPRGYWLKSR